MQGIEITLKRNKQYIAENKEEYEIISGENNATTILVHFPEEYKDFSKRVDFKNVRNEKWSIALFTPEDETKNYGSDFDKLNFAFTLPTPVTVNGELQIQFIAYMPDATETFVPFKLFKVVVENSIMYVKKQGSENPDLILQAYEYANMALEISRDAFAGVDNAERAAIEAETNAKSAQASATSAQSSAASANTKASNAEASAKSAQASAKSAQASAEYAEQVADEANTKSTNAVSTANSADVKSTNAVSTANSANIKSDKVVEILDTLTVSGEAIGSEEQVAVKIQTNASNQHKNIAFSIPAPKQGKSYRNIGDWNASTNYVNNTYYIDTVYYEGSSYYCKVSNKNQKPIPSEESTYWGLLAKKGNDAGVIIIDNLDSERSDYVLSAKQGKILKEMNCQVVQKKLDDSEITINNIILVEV